MEADDPKRAVPKTDTDDAKRAKERKEMELPMWTKSRTETEDPTRAKERNDNELPTCMKSITETE
jgi:hypothetical protein